MDIRMTDAMFYDCDAQYLTAVSRYASRGVVLNEHKKAAMMRMNSKGYYKLPGGGLEYEESKEQAFIREVMEETGYPCEILQELGVIEEHKNKNAFFQYSYCFLGRITGDRQETKLTPNEQRLGFELSWMDLDEAISLMDQTIQNNMSYGDSFMLRRDIMILQYAQKIVKELR